MIHRSAYTQRLHLHHTRPFLRRNLNNGPRPDTRRPLDFGATLRSVGEVVKLNILPSPDGIKNFVELAHMATQFPTVLETDVNKRQIFSRLMDKRRQILSLCLDFYLQENPGVEPAFSKSMQGHSEHEIDLMRVIALLFMKNSSTIMDELLLQLNEPVTEDARIALEGVIKVLIDSIRNHLGEAKHESWLNPGTEPTPNVIAILNDPLLRELRQSSIEFSCHFHFEGEMAVSLGAYGIPGAALLGGASWLLGVENPHIAFAPIFLWLLWCVSRTPYLAWKYNPMAIEGKKLHRRYVGLVKQILISQSILSKIETFVKIFRGQNIPFPPVMEQNLRHQIEIVSQLMVEGINHLKTCVDDPAERFFTIPWFPHSKIREQKRTSTQIGTQLQVELHPLREIRDGLKVHLVENGLQL